eukprot:scaffold3270_cov106-Phaeocystis_antarctica.AAC.2
MTETVAATMEAAAAAMETAAAAMETAVAASMRAAVAKARAAAAMEPAAVAKGGSRQWSVKSKAPGSTLALISTSTCSTSDIDSGSCMLSLPPYRCGQCSAPQLAGHHVAGRSYRRRWAAPAACVQNDAAHLGTSTHLQPQSRAA